MKSKRILVVDDEPHILFILEKELLKHGCIIDKAESGADAIKLLKEREYDIMILDIMMPAMSGIEVCQWIKSNPKTESKPIVILSADQDERDKDKCISLGVSDYITKPFRPKDIAARIKEILNKYSKS